MIDDVSQLVITASDLLQANVTLIAGIFVLLTISILSQRAGRIVLLLIVFTTIPFVISSYLLLRTIGLDVVESGFHFGLATVSFMVGLAWIALTIALIGIVIARTPTTGDSGNQSS